MNSAYAQQHLKNLDANTTTEDSSLEKESERANNRVSRNIEEKENEILEQCIKNEKLSSDPSSYVVDCSEAIISNQQSRFPLPDHLNYPICRYRMKSESNNRTHPLQKLKNGWKKLKSKKLFGDKHDQSADTDCYPEFYPEFVKPTNSDEDDEIVLSRLSRNPNQRKNFAQRVLNRFGSKSYSINTSECFEHERISRIARSGSTRSVPDALQDMWNKTHFTSEDAPIEQSNRGRGISRGISMPSIHTESYKDINTNENNGNYFYHMGNDTENNDHILNNGNDVADRLSSLQITDTNCLDKSDRKVCFDENTSTQYDERTRQHGEFSDDNISNSLMKSPKKFSSCHELYQRSTSSTSQNTQSTPNNKFMAPQPMYYTPPQPQYACYAPNQQQVHHNQVQFLPFYAYHPNYMYQVPHGVPQVPSYGPYPPMEFVPNFYPINGYYPPNGEQYNMINNSSSRVQQRTVDTILAPLDVKIGHEKVAEKRKISEMVFDTFV